MWQGEKRAVLLPAYRASDTLMDFYKARAQAEPNAKIAPKTDGEYLSETHKELPETAILFGGKIMYIEYPYVVTTTPVTYKFNDTTGKARLPHVYITERPHGDTNATRYHPFTRMLYSYNQGSQYRGGQYRSQRALYEVRMKQKKDEEFDYKNLKDVTDFLRSEIPNGLESSVPGLRNFAYSWGRNLLADPLS